jgi:hypothetical protein
MIHILFGYAGDRTFQVFNLWFEAWIDIILYVDI